MSSKDNYIIKYQWLEQKCIEYKQEIKLSHKKIQRLEQLFSERDTAYQLYNDQVVYDTRLIQESLDGNEDAYKKFIAVASPRSYDDFYYNVLPELCKFFAMFIRIINVHIDFLKIQSYTPIFIQIMSGYQQDLQKKLNTIHKRLEYLSVLLESTNWSTNLDDSSVKVKQQLISWLNSAKDILHKTIEKFECECLAFSITIEMS